MTLPTGDSNEDDSDNEDYNPNTDSRSDSGDDDDRAETTDNNNGETGTIVEPITDFDNDEEQENIPDNATTNQQQDVDQAVIDQRMRQSGARCLWAVEQYTVPPRDKR
jgi:hypothetical protein